MDKPRITYAPLPNAAPETELAVLSNIYAFVLKASRKKKGTRPGAPDDAKGPKHDRAEISIHD
jgi:hypothetical protein